jgi:hypothetical protein
MLQQILRSRVLRPRAGNKHPPQKEPQMMTFLFLVGFAATISLLVAVASESIGLA